MTRWELASAAIVAAVAAVAGWLARDSRLDLPAAAHVPAMGADRGVAAMLRSPHVPTAPPPSVARHHTTQEAVVHACPEPPRATAEARDTARLQQTLRDGGSEAERHAALLALLADGGQVPVEVLRQAVENDASDRVRLLAFTAWMDAIVSDVQATKAALDAAQYIPSAAVQAEARRRGDELAAYEQAVADGRLRFTN